MMDDPLFEPAADEQADPSVHASGPRVNSIGEHRARPMTGPDLPEGIRAAHDAAVAAGEDGYVDPATGYFVFTAAYLAARRSCCDSGCRHCPYDD